jgi:hypothetical protein
MPRISPVKNLRLLLLSLNPQDWVSQSKARGKTQRKQKKNWRSAFRDGKTGIPKFKRAIRVERPKT